MSPKLLHCHPAALLFCDLSLAVGGSDVGVIRYLLKIEGLEKRGIGAALEVGWLQCYERPQPNLCDYDLLIHTLWHRPTVMLSVAGARFAALARSWIRLAELKVTAGS